MGWLRLMPRRWDPGCWLAGKFDMWETSNVGVDCWRRCWRSVLWSMFEVWWDSIGNASRVRKGDCRRYPGLIFFWSATVRSQYASALAFCRFMREVVAPHAAQGAATGQSGFLETFQSVVQSFQICVFDGRPCGLRASLLAPEFLGFLSYPSNERPGSGGF